MSWIGRIKNSVMWTRLNKKISYIWNLQGERVYRGDTILLASAPTGVYLYLNGVVHRAKNEFELEKYASCYAYIKLVP